MISMSLYICINLYRLHLFFQAGLSSYGLTKAPLGITSSANTLVQLGFKSTISDPSFINTTILLLCLFSYKLMIFFITGLSPMAIKSLISTINQTFTLKDLGKLHYFLSIEAHWKPDGSFFLTWTKCVQQFLQKANMIDVKPQPFPMVLSIKLTVNGSTTFQDPTLYRQIVECSSVVNFHLFIHYAVNKVSQYMHNPQLHHWKAVKQMRHHIAATSYFDLCFPPSTTSSIRGFANTDQGLISMIANQTPATAYILVIISSLGRSESNILFPKAALTLSPKALLQLLSKSPGLILYFMSQLFAILF